MTNLQPSLLAGKSPTDQIELLNDALAWVGELNTSLLRAARNPSMETQQKSRQRNLSYSEPHARPERHEYWFVVRWDKQREAVVDLIVCHDDIVFRTTQASHATIPRETMTTQPQRSPGTCLQNQRSLCWDVGETWTQDETPNRGTKKAFKTSPPTTTVA